VHRARERGLDAVAIPLFEVEPVAWQAPDIRRFDGLLLTSANALRHGGPELEALKSLPVYAVGAATADAAIEAGFTVAGMGNAGVDRLLASCRAGLRLLHLCGEHRNVPSGAKQPIIPIPVYNSKARVPPPDLSGVEDAVLLVHSPRAGARLCEILGPQFNWAGVAVAAIGPAAAKAVADHGGRVEAAQNPNDDALLALAERLCNKPQR
jgi:uroporphyrinogen-III synthase